MDKSSKSTSFILYPFIGLFSIFKWAILGITSTLSFLSKPLTNILLYALKGLKYIFGTIPGKMMQEATKKSREEKAKKEAEMATAKSKLDAETIKKMTLNEQISKKSVPKELAADTSNELVSNSNVMINKKDRRKIMKERQAKHREEQKALKEKNKLNRQLNGKLQAEKEILISDLASGDVKRTDKPVAFRYKAIDPKGKMVTGTFTGSSKLDVNAYLVNEGYDVYSIKTSNMINFLYGQPSFGGAKMSNKDLIFWLTQLYTYVKSGIPLTDSVKILSNQMGKKKNRKRVFEKIIYELTMGAAFSDALAKQGNVFPSLLINMLKAAEATGELEETLNDMANYYREIESTRKQMVSAMTYPAIITIFSGAVITFILLYVIPKFTQVYDTAGVTINGFTKAIIDASNFLKNNISVILLIAFAIILVLVVAYKKVKFFRKNMQTLLMHVPIIGKVMIYNEMTIFTKTFASLLKNNVFITESIEILSKVTNNEIYKEIMYNTITNIARGEKISESFKDHWAIPDVAYYMIVTGESTGELAAMMENVSKYYQEQHRGIVNNLKSFIEPIMITSLAVVVGAIILAVIIPMFDLYNNIM